MQKDKYIKCLERIQNSKAKFTALKLAYKILPLLMFIAYPSMLIVKGFMALDLKFYLMIGVPAGVLLLVTGMRKVIKRERPYEKFDTPPIIDRDGSGESFPSRHTASAFIIAMSGFALTPYLGIVLLVNATLIGLTRLFSGVHFATDVLAGMIISVFCGTIAFVLI